MGLFDVNMEMKNGCGKKGQSIPNSLVKSQLDEGNEDVNAKKG
jgi:hypothetical protein